MSVDEPESRETAAGRPLSVEAVGVVSLVLGIVAIVAGAFVGVAMLAVLLLAGLGGTDLLLAEGFVLLAIAAIVLVVVGLAVCRAAMGLKSGSRASWWLLLSVHLLVVTAGAASNLVLRDGYVTLLVGLSLGCALGLLGPRARVWTGLRTGR